MLKTKENKGITLIALVITIIVLLILAGITIAQITEQDSAPQKAAESKNENTKGAMKDTANLLATQYIQDYYDKKYVKNLSDFTYENQREYAESQFETETEGGYTYSISEHALTVEDTNGNIVTATINSNGTITWDESSSGNSAGTKIKVGNKKVDLSKLNAESVAQYYGTTVVTLDGIDYGLFYVDYAGTYSNGVEGTVYLRAKSYVDTIKLYNVSNITDEALEIMRQLNPSWAEARGTTEIRSLYYSEKGAAYLCNPDVSTWEGAKNAAEAKYGVNNVNYVIGAPSAELFFSSYNAKYKSIYSVDFNMNGNLNSTYTYPGYIYYYKYNETINYATSYRSAIRNAEDGMYALENRHSWLASPFTHKYEDIGGWVTGEGNLSSASNYGGRSVVPLISLKPGVDLTK